MCKQDSRNNIVVFGATGIIFGPMVGAMFITVWELWGSAIEVADPFRREP